MTDELDGDEMGTDVSKVTGRDGVLMVTRRYKAGGVLKKEEDDNEKIEVRPFVADVAHVGHNARMTVNLGDYESVQIGVLCVLPTHVEELDEAYKAAKEFVDLRLNAEVKSVKDYRKTKGSKA